MEEAYGEMRESSTPSRSDFYPSFIVPLLAGGIAGLTADVVLFPLDTIKTRLQSRRGFLASGGFHKIYAGIGPAAAGSAPSAAAFFCTYELMKRFLGPHLPDAFAPVVHMTAATAGEVVSNILRVPFELIKQRSQANRHKSPLLLVREALRIEGPRGLYRGYFSTIAREVPFSFTQYPLWEFLKGSPLEPWQGAVCGAMAGGTAAAITTPLDVAKTRVMLAKAGSDEVAISIPQLLLKIGRQEGIKGLFSGFIPRVTWITLGGFVFLGAYEKSKHTLLNLNQSAN